MNSNMDEALATAHLTKARCSAEHINRALFQVRKEADNPAHSLYENNKAVYELLRYGVPMKKLARRRRRCG